MSQPSTPATDDTFHWGGDVVDTSAWDLPGLKAKFLTDHAPRSGRVVEIGCGAGKMLRTLAVHRPELRLSGCDLRAPEPAPTDFEFRAVNAQSAALPYESASFEAVAVMDVLEHVPTPADTLDEVRRILVPGGLLVAFVPIEGEALGAHRLYRSFLGQDLYVRTKEHVQAFSHEALDSLVSARFEVERREYVYHALGQTMDATLFALTSIPAIGRLFWQDNRYYNAEPKKPSLVSRVFNGALTTANAVAYLESRLLASKRFLAGGQLLVARRPL